MDLSETHLISLACVTLARLQALYIPFMRQIWTWLGSVPATREIFFSHLADGYSCVVCPGGLRETQHMNSGSEVNTVSHI